jgi:hypothetical protein
MSVIGEVGEVGEVATRLGRCWRARMVIPGAQGIDITSAGLERRWNTYPDEYSFCSGDHAIFDYVGSA